MTYSAISFRSFHFASNVHMTQYIYMVYIYVLFSTKQGTALYLAFCFNIVYTETNTDAGKLEKSHTHVKEVFFNTFPNTSHHYQYPFQSPPSSISTSPKGPINEALAPRAHQEELPSTLYNKDKGFGFNSKVPRTTAYHRKIVEEIKGIPRDFVRWKEVCKVTQLFCGLTVLLASSYSVTNVSVYIKMQRRLQPCHEFHVNSSL